MPISPGLIVHFHPNGRAAIGGSVIDNDQPMAGIIACDHGNGSVNLLIIDHEGTPFSYCAPLIEKGDPVPEPGSTSYCCWPEDDSAIGAGITDEPNSTPESETHSSPGGDTVGVEAPSTEVANPVGGQDTDAGVDASETMAAASS